MPTVVNKYKEAYDVLIMRGTKWGNPFPMQNKSDAERARVINEYQYWLMAQIKSGKITLEELKALKGKRLGCCCAPKPCHGDVLVKACHWAFRQI